MFLFERTRDELAPLQGVTMYFTPITTGILFGIVGFYSLPSTIDNVVTLSVYDVPDVGFKTYTVDIPYAENIPMLSLKFPEINDSSTLFATPGASVLEKDGIIRLSVTVGNDVANTYI
jgi:hypothetical protein